MERSYLRFLKIKNTQNSTGHKTRLLFFFGYALGMLGVSGCSSAKSQDKDVVTAKYVHRYGVEVNRDDWDERGGDGQVIKHLKTGVTLKQSFYQGKLHGITTHSFPYGEDVERVLVYNQGHLQTETWNYPSGMPSKKSVYKEANVMESASWYEDGSPRNREEYQGSLLVQGQYWTLDNQSEATVTSKDGQRIVRDGKGKLLAKEDIQNGEAICIEKFYENGLPKEKTPYVHGQVNGTRQTFNQDGSPLTVEEWKDGKLNGVLIRFENGIKVAEVPYVNGIKEGIEKRYKSGKDVYQEITWYKDLKHGPTTFYASGKEVTEWYFEGRSVSKMHYQQLSRGALPKSSRIAEQ